MKSNFEKHLNTRLLESQLKMAANNRIPLNLIDCFKPADICFFEQQMNEVDADIIEAKKSKNNIVPTLGICIGFFGNSHDYRDKEYLDTQANILKHAQALDMVSPVFDLLSIPNHAHLTQYLVRYNEVCRVHCNYVDPQLLATLTKFNFLPVDVRKDSYISNDGVTAFIRLFGTDYRVSPEIRECIKNGENLALYLDYRVGQLYTLPIEILKVLLDIDAVVTHNIETLNKAKLYERDLNQKLHLIRCENELKIASQNLQTNLIYQVAVKLPRGTHLVTKNDVLIDGIKIKAGQPLCKTRKGLVELNIPLRLSCEVCRDKAGLQIFK